MADAHLEELATRYFERSLDALEEEERRVLIRLHEQKPTSRDAAALADQQATFGERIADRVAAIGGSWSFIIAFMLGLMAWVLLNTDVLPRWTGTFDPYPYIFLNLILSMLAAIQAPIIMMSQNRQAAKDRLAASIDFEVNLRAELEILRLHNKLDHAILAPLEALAEQQAVLKRILLDGRTPAP